MNRHAQIAANQYGPDVVVAATGASIDKLLDSANTASTSARNAWLAFLILLAYLMVTVSGVTHVDLLLNSAVTLPIANVEVPLFSFFSVAPFILLLVHLGLMVQHVTLGHKLHHLSEMVSKLEDGDEREHAVRLNVSSYVFAQIMAGQKPPPMLSFLMWLMVFTTLIVLPILMLLYFQIKFLPYHDVGVTHIHRFAIFLEAVLLFVVPPLVANPYLMLADDKKLRLGRDYWPWELSYRNLVASLFLWFAVFIFSLFIATVPQGCFWPSEKNTNSCFSLDNFLGEWAQPSSLVRNLVVTNTDLVQDKEDQYGEVSISLRGRDLRFANLGRSDLHRADLSEAKLQQAMLIATRLENALLEYSDLQGAYLSGASLQGANLKRSNLQGANLEGASLQGANLKRSNLRGANLKGAKLQEADLSAVKLQGANLLEANLQGVNLSGASLVGANLREANLQFAKLSSVNLHEVNLLEANLQGADLSGVDLEGVELEGAYLQGADFSSANLPGMHFYMAGLEGANFLRANLQGANLLGANLQGVNLSGASLVGANLREANLRGAALNEANLQGADLHGAYLQGSHLYGASLLGADLRETSIWLTYPPAEGELNLADLTSAEIRPLTDGDLKYIKEYIDEKKDTPWGNQLKISLEPLFASENLNWIDSEQYRTWKLLLSRATSSDHLSVFLAELACYDYQDGYIAKTITSRVLSPNYNGSLSKFLSEVSHNYCSVVNTLDVKTKAILCELDSWTEGDAKKTFCTQ